MPSPFDTADSPLLLEEVNYVTGGYVSNTESHLLTPDQAVRLLNIDPTVAGRRQKRLGPDPIGSAGLGNPNGLHAFHAPQQDLRLLAGNWGNELFTTPGNDDVWTRRASQVSFANTLYLGTQGRGRAALPTLYLASCVAVTDNVSLPYAKLVAVDAFLSDATSVTELAVRPRSISWFQSRLWGFNSGVSGPDYLFWSAPFDGRDFSNGQTVQIGPDDGQEGVAIVPMRDGTPRLMLFKERAIYQLEIYWATDGYYPTTANALDFTKSLLRPISLNPGCVGTQALCWTPGQENADLLFLSREGIRSLKRSLTDAQGGAGPPLSFRIQPTIDRINWAQAHRTVAAFWNDKAYFSLPVDGATKPNFVLAYDVNRDSFYELDLNVSSWAEAKIGNERSFFFQASSSGTEVGYGGTGSGATNGYHVYKTDVGLSDPFGQPIQYEEQTRAFTFDTAQPQGSGLRYKKKWSHIELAIQSAATHCTLTISYKVDEDDSWSDLDYLYINPEDGYPYLPVQLPFGFSIGKVLNRSRLLREVRPGYKIQFRIKDTNSFARLKIISLRCGAFAQNPKYGNVRL
jgi:hypothetical protein